MSRKVIINLLCPSGRCEDCINGYIKCEDCDKILNKLLDEYEATIRTDERINTIQFIHDEFNRRTVHLGRASAKTYIIDTLNEILKELNEKK